VTGKIDRLCELDDGTWVVIDYKSELVNSDNYAIISENYEVSMHFYREAIKSLLKKNTVEGTLYFIDAGEFFPLSQY
jgi:ATP-dependent exoDNAse (exonuclease V) beta subunit